MTGAVVITVKEDGKVEIESPLSLPDSVTVVASALSILTRETEARVAALVSDAGKKAIG